MYYTIYTTLLCVVVAAAASAHGGRVYELRKLNKGLAL